MVTVTNNDHHPDGGLVVPYATRRELRQQHGPAAAAVLDVLAFHYTTDGVAMRHADVATESGMPVISVRRAIEKLCETGWVKRVYQVHGDRQIVNRYEIPASVVPDRHEHPGDRIEQAPYSYTSLVDTYISEHDQEGDVSRQGIGGEPSGSLPGPSIEDFEEFSAESDRNPVAPRKDLGLPRGDRGVRCARNARRNLFTRITESKEIASVFQARVEEATGRGIRGKQRIKGFETSARVMLTDHRPVADIMAVIDYITDVGLLADSAGPGKIRNLKEVRDLFDMFLDYARNGIPEIPATPSMTDDERRELRTRLENHR